MPTPVIYGFSGAQGSPVFHPFLPSAPPTIPINWGLVAAPIPVPGPKVIVQQNQGTVNPTAASFLRQHLSPAYRGKEVDALLGAIGDSEQKVIDLAASAFDQMFRSTASGKYLERKASDYGIQKPKDVGISDVLFRRLSIEHVAQKLTWESISNLLEIFYGPDATRASITTGESQPFVMQDGQTLNLLVDEADSFALSFSGSEFSNPAAASAAEVSYSITRQLSLLGSACWAVPWFDPEDETTRVRIYSPALGVEGAVRVTGGSAQNSLQFPNALQTLTGSIDVFGVQTGQTWVVSAPAAGTMRLTLSGPTSVDLTQVRSGDYANIFGAPFLAANQGSFPVTRVDVRYVAGSIVQFVEVINPGVTPQTVTIAAVSDVIFFRPVRGAINSAQAAIAVQSGPKSSVVQLPATSTAVTRTPPHAAYLKQNPVLIPQTIQRAGTTVRVTNANPHGILPGQWVWIDDAWGSDAAPASVPGNSALTNGNPLSFWDTLLTPSGSASVTLEGARGATLQSGNALVCGGRNLVSGTHFAQTRSVLFSVTSTAVGADSSIRYGYSWLVTAPLPVGREFHSVVGLLDAQQGGNALALGGYNGGTTTPLSDSYVYNVSGNTWSSNLPMTISRAAPGVTILVDNRVLACGGGTGGTVGATAEIFTPSGAGGSWTAVSPMSSSRACHTATTLSSGKVLVCGGAQIPGGSTLDQVLNLTGPITSLCTAEVYDPATNTWARTGNMATARAWHAAVKLPGDQVLVVGGFGRDPSSTAANAQLTLAEVWDSATGQWLRCDPLPGAAPLSADGSLSAFWHAPSSRAIVITPSDAFWFDPAKRTWTRGIESQPLPIRTKSTNLMLGVGATLSVEGDSAGSTSNVTTIWIPNSDYVSRGGLVGLYQVVSVPDPDSLTYSTPCTSGYTLNNNTLNVTALEALGFPLVFPIQLGAAESSAIANGLLNAAQMFCATALPSLPGQPGPYVLDPNAGVAITSVSTASTAPIYAEHSYNSLPVVSAGRFPDKPGYVVLGFGQSYQIGPVKYFGRLSTTELLLDRSFVMPGDVPSGADVTLLEGNAPFDPPNPQDLGLFHLTSSNSGRIAAELFIEDALAAGLNTNVEVLYPGDRGLGNEGQPDAGSAKINDQVEIWGSDSIDSDVAIARGGL